MARTWVLLRGLVRGKGHWLGFAEKLQAAFPEDKVIALDLPGNGSLHHQPSPVTGAGMVRSARQQLQALEATAGAPYTVVAISLGGMVTLEWLRQAPSEIRQAFIINASLASLSSFRQRLQPANYGGLLRWGILNRDALKKERYVLSVNCNLLDDAERAQCAHALATLPPVSAPNALRQLLAAARYRAPAALFGQPVVVISGAADRLVSAKCSQAIAKHWGWPLLTHPQAGHDLPLDDPQWLLACLQQQVL